MLRKLFSSKKFIIGLVLILIAFLLMILQSHSDFESTRDCSYPNAWSSYSYSNTGEKELRQKINEKVDRIIEIIDELSD